MVFSQLVLKGILMGLDTFCWLSYHLYIVWLEFNSVIKIFAGKEGENKREGREGGSNWGSEEKEV